MTIAEYEELTGITVSAGETNRVKAAIRKAEVKLGSLLGYSLSKQKEWTDLGNVQFDGYVPFPSLPISEEKLNNLKEPDEVIGGYQLFNFDELDTHIRINPAKEVYRAKIVLPVNEDEFITIHNLENVTPYLNNSGLVVALSRYSFWYTWGWWNSISLRDRANLMIAVDARFVNVCDANKYPELAYLLADMVTYYSDPNYSIMGNIRSESIDSHSYSRASTGKTPDESAPEGQLEARKIVQKYAGPAAFRKLVR